AVYLEVMMSLLDAALDYAAHGWKVFPLIPGHKEPLTDHGFKDATSDADQIRAWWLENSEANIGIATGADSFVVVDIDQKSGKNGYAAVEALNLPGGTPTQMTPSGGMHVCLAPHLTVRNSGDKLGLGIDTRGDGGYIVAAPSVVNGQPYTWLVPYTTPLAPVPAAVLEKW